MVVTHTYQPPQGYEQQEPVIIVVMGVTGVGKSTFIEHATGQKVVVGHGQESCTSEVTSFQIPDTNVWLVDTPGFDDTFTADATILDRIDQCLADFFNMHQKIAGVVYIHPIIEARMKGSAMKNLSMFRKVVGKDNMSSCCLVTTKWSLQSEATSLSRENEIKNNPKFWQPLIAQGARIARFADSMESAIAIIKPLVNMKGFTPKITIETQVQGKKLVDTDAGREVNVNLEEAVKAHKADLADLAKQHKQAIDDKDAELARLIEEERQTLAGELETMKSERELLRATIEKRSEGRSVMRWIARGAAAIVATAATIVTAGGAIGPAALLYGTVEALAQVDRANEKGF